MRASAVSGRSETDEPVNRGWPDASIAPAPDTLSSAGRMLSAPEMSATAASTATRAGEWADSASLALKRRPRHRDDLPRGGRVGNHPGLPAPARRRVDGLARDVATGDVVGDVLCRFVRVDRVLLAGELVDRQVDGRLAHPSRRCR